MQGESVAKPGTRMLINLNVMFKFDILEVLGSKIIWEESDMQHLGGV